MSHVCCSSAQVLGAPNIGWATMEEKQMTIFSLCFLVVMVVTFIDLHPGLKAPNVTTFGVAVINVTSEFSQKTTLHISLYSLQLCKHKLGGAQPQPGWAWHGLPACTLTLQRPLSVTSQYHLPAWPAHIDTKAKGPERTGSTWLGSGPQYFNLPIHLSSPGTSQGRTANVSLGLKMGTSILLPDP